ncbi:MAG: hypothetical protein ABEH64_11080, partial [Salinirussus sp.]
MVLLIGIVLVGAVTVVVLGAGTLSDAQGETKLESAEKQLNVYDAKLSTLAVSEDRTRVRLDADDALVNDIHLLDGGTLNVTVDRNGTCSFSQQLRTIHFTDNRDRVVAYQAGGLFRSDRQSSTVISPPALTFENGALDIRLVNISGQLNRINNALELNRSRTRSRTQSHMAALQQGDCQRPDNLTIWINSTFQRGWFNYLQSEVGGGVGTVESFAN